MQWFVWCACVWCGCVIVWCACVWSWWCGHVRGVHVCGGGGGGVCMCGGGGSGGVCMCGSGRIVRLFCHHLVRVTN